MPRKGENIYKRKDGRWEARYIKMRTQQGRVVYGYVYARSYAEVKKKQHCAMTEAWKKVNCGCLYPAGSSFDAISREWLDALRPHVKESTYIKYRNLMDSYLLPYFGKLPLENMTADQISAFCNRLITEGGVSGKGLSPKTVADTLSVLRNILSYARGKGISLSCTGKEVSIRQKSPGLRVLSGSEQKMLCRYLNDHPSPKNFGVLLCLFTGLRIGEICALKWEDISVDDKVIHVHQTMQRIQTTTDGLAKTRIIITAPKSERSIRTIPLPGKIVCAIAGASPVRRGFVLTGNNSYVEPRAMEYHFKRVLKAAQIENVNFHVLRHTFATRCIEVGFDVKCLSEILGHANVNITLNRYVHPTMQLKQDNMQKLSDLLSVS